MRYALVGLALLACRSDSAGDTDAGTIVGNPGDAMVRTASSDGVVYTEAGGWLNHLELVDCHGESELIDFDDEFDLLDPDVLEIPSGDWCEWNLDWDEEIYIAADGEENNSFEVTLDLNEIFTEGEFEIDEDGGYILEIGFPEWLSPSALGMVADDVTYVDAPGALHDELVDYAVFESAAFDDTDGDGEISDDERDAGPISAGEDRDDQPPPEEEDPDTTVDGVNAKGCGKNNASWLVLLPLAWLFRREED